GGPLQSLRALLAESRIALSHDLPPMSAGLFGYMGYDMARLMERLATPNPDPLGVPDGIMVRPTVMCIFDSVKDEVTLVTPVFADPASSARAAYAQACERLDSVMDGLDRPLDQRALDDPHALPIAAAQSNTSPEEYCAMVLRAKDYIAAG